MYQVFVANHARKIIKKFAKDLRREIYEEASKLRENPLAGEKLKGKLSFLYSLHFRYKNVDYRIAYVIDHKKKVITLQLVGMRENFYEKLRRIFGC